jgi:hypothetical protein
MDHIRNDNKRARIVRRFRTRIRKKTRKTRAPGKERSSETRVKI